VKKLDTTIFIQICSSVIEEPVFRRIEAHAPITSEVMKRDWPRDLDEGHGVIRVLPIAVRRRKNATWGDKLAYILGLKRKGGNLDMVCRYFFDTFRDLIIGHISMQFYEEKNYIFVCNDCHL